MISGDLSKKNYDEVGTAKKYAEIRYNYNKNLLFLDHAGFNTYATMYRARDVFCIEDAVITTQEFHIYRSVYIARKLGLNAAGYISPAKNPFKLSVRLNWQIRESLARVKAFFYCIFLPKPKFLGEQIPITGNGSETWD